MVSHFIKASKGRLVRALLEDGRDARTGAELAELLTDLGWTVEAGGKPMLDGKPIRGLAREIAEKTGQPVPSVRRRLQEMKAGGRFKRMRARRKVSGLFSTQD